MIPLFLLLACESASGVHSLEKEELEDWEFADIGEAVEDKQIVFIGEATHGSEKLTEMKAELVQYLSGNHGFSILAMESGKYEMDYLNSHWDRFDDEFMMKGMMYDAWHTPAMEDLIGYVRGSDSLTLKGLDPWPVLSGRRIGESGFHQTLRDRMSEENSSLAAEFIEVDNRFIRYMNALVYDEENMTDLDEAGEILEQYRAFLHNEGALTETELAFVNGRISVLADYFNEDFLAEEYHETPHQAYFSRRDSAMFHELNDLMEENPDDKIIVWAHNGHIQKNFGLIEQTDEELAEAYEPPPLVLGSLAAEQWGDDAYFIGWYFNEGSIQFPDGRMYDIEPKEEDDELEYILSEYDERKLFVDLSAHDEEWTTSAVTAYSDGFFHYRMIPSEQYDGIIFVENVGPE